MANQSIYDAFARFWQHTLAKVSNASTESNAYADNRLVEAKNYTDTKIADLAGTIPEEQVQSDWNISDTSSAVYILNKLPIYNINATVPESGIYRIEDLFNDVSAMIDNVKEIENYDGYYKKCFNIITTSSIRIDFEDATYCWINGSSIINVHYGKYSDGYVEFIFYFFDPETEYRIYVKCYKYNEDSDLVIRSYYGRILFKNEYYDELNTTDGSILGAINECYDRTHIHDNKDILDGITSDLLANWNYAYTHSASDHAPSDAQANTIEDIKVNDTSVPVTDKSVNITVPTNVSELTNDSGYLTSSFVDETELNAMLTEVYES